MQLLPLVGLYWRRSKELSALVPKAASDKSSQEILDLLTALAPVVKKYYPTLNANGLVDDVIATMKEVLAPPPPST